MASIPPPPSSVNVPAGLCQCGCGQSTRIATRNEWGRNIAKGQPHRFVSGHTTARQPLAARFWSRVDKSGDCWLWQGGHLKAGYGTIQQGGRAGRTLATHRVAWELTYGPIPPGLYVCHHCDNPPCCNPDHLFLGTHLENSLDRVAKGRAVRFAPRGERCGRAKLTDGSVRAARALYTAGGISNREVARRFNVHPNTMYAVLHNKTWAHVK